MAVVVKDRICRQCGAVFRGGPRAWYCPKCRRERAKMASQKHKAAGTARPLGSTDYCVICGKPYIVKSARQKYCPACAHDAVRAIDREASKSWNQLHKDTYYPDKNAKRRAARAENPEPIRQKERESRARRRAEKQK